MKATTQKRCTQNANFWGWPCLNIKQLVSFGTIEPAQRLLSAQKPFFFCAAPPNVRRMKPANQTFGTNMWREIQNIFAAHSWKWTSIASNTAGKKFWPTTCSRYLQNSETQNSNLHNIAAMKFRWEGTIERDHVFLPICTWYQSVRHCINTGQMRMEMRGSSTCNGEIPNKEIPRKNNFGKIMFLQNDMHRQWYLEFMTSLSLTKLHINETDILSQIQLESTRTALVICNNLAVKTLHIRTASVRGFHVSICCWDDAPIWLDAANALFMFETQRIRFLVTDWTSMNKVSTKLHCLSPIGTWAQLWHKFPCLSFSVNMQSMKTIEWRKHVQVLPGFKNLGMLDFESAQMRIVCSITCSSQHTCVSQWSHKFLGFHKLTHILQKADLYRMLPHTMNTELHTCSQVLFKRLSLGMDIRCARMEVSGLEVILDHHDFVKPSTAPKMVHLSN